MNLNNNILHDPVKWIVFSKCLPHSSYLISFLWHFDFTTTI